VTGELNVRTANSADVARIALLAGQLGYPATEREISPRFAALEGQTDHAVFVADYPSTKVIGWLHVFIRPLLESDAAAEIGGLIVDERFRGRGVARALVDASARWGQRCGVGYLRVRSNVTRESALRFYTGLGFREAKTQRVLIRILADDAARGHQLRE